MRFLELRIPPPLVFLIVGTGMWAAAPFGPMPGIPLAVRVSAALIIGAAGAAVVIAAMISFRRAQTTISPLSPEESTSLISTGVFSLSRNPIYLGGTVLLFAWMVYLAAPIALLGPLAFVLYITQFQILPEERALGARFGSSFAQYKARVRRWV